MNCTVLKIIMTAFGLFQLSQAIELKFVTREEWNARPQSENPNSLALPIPKVIIAHTATNNCTDKNSCIRRVRNIQDYHMDSLKFCDIAYNFLIGGDGLIYEGRGWGKQGAHTKEHNVDSIGIAFIGTFNSTEPTKEQLQVAQLLLEQGVSVELLSSDYKLYGHRQLRPTISPGDSLYEIIKYWPHWSEVTPV